VTIGRETRHDVVIPGPSVSRFHAFAKPSPDGSFLLQDMGSTNGTTVNAVSVPARGGGSPSPLKPGDTVRFGQVEFTFTDARALQEYALQAAS
jgi:pSer/pThr/pTyr-binding forkhead associated (FHA) protein